jgi:hypothetical protein
VVKTRTRSYNVNKQRLRLRLRLSKSVYAKQHRLQGWHKQDQVEELLEV